MTLPTHTPYATRGSTEHGPYAAAVARTPTQSCRQDAPPPEPFGGYEAWQKRSAATFVDSCETFQRVDRVATGRLNDMSHGRSTA